MTTARPDARPAVSRLIPSRCVARTRAPLRRLLVCCGAVALLGACMPTSDGRPVAIGQGRYLIGEPYTVGGVTYTPAETFAYEEIGFASIRDSGGATVNGDRFDPTSLMAAHPTLQLPSFVRVTNLANDRSLVLMVNDRGPGIDDRLIAVSTRAAELLVLPDGGPVRVQIMPAESRAVADLAGRGSGVPDGPALAAAPVSSEPLREPDAAQLAEEVAGPAASDAGDDPDAAVETAADIAVDTAVDTAAAGAPDAAGTDSEPAATPLADGDAAPEISLPESPLVENPIPAAPTAAGPVDARAAAIAEARRLAELSGDADADRESRLEAGLPAETVIETAPGEGPADPDAAAREADLAALIEAAMDDRVSDRPESTALIDSTQDADTAAATPTLLGEDDTEMATLFYVQFGVFRELANAERLRGQLESEGDAIVSPYEQEGETLYRVWLGPFESDAVAAQTLQRLIDDGVIDEAQIMIN